MKDIRTAGLCIDIGNYIIDKLGEELGFTKNDWNEHFEEICSQYEAEELYY